MNIKFLVIILSFFIVFGCNSEQETRIFWETVEVSADGNFMAAAAMNGYIYVFDFKDDDDIPTDPDNGDDEPHHYNRWIKTTSGRRNWTGLALSENGKQIAACARFGYIYISDDYGMEWEEIDPLPNRPDEEKKGYRWSAIASSLDGKTLAAAASSGVVVLDPDEYADPNDPPEIELENGAIYVSTNSGVTWGNANVSKAIFGMLPTLIPNFPELDFNWRTITMTGDGKKMVAGCSPGIIFSSENSGTDWTYQFSSYTLLELMNLNLFDLLNFWMDISYSHDGSILIGAYKDYITDSPPGQSILEKSTNNGSTWAPLNTNHNTEDTNWLSTASSSDGKILAAALNGEYIYISNNSGVNWEAKLIDKPRNWYSISLSGKGDVIIASDYDGSIYTSRDGGDSWEEHINENDKWTRRTVR